MKLSFGESIKHLDQIVCWEKKHCTQYIHLLWVVDLYFPYPHLESNIDIDYMAIHGLLHSVVHGVVHGVVNGVLHGEVHGVVHVVLHGEIHGVVDGNTWCCASPLLLCGSLCITASGFLQLQKENWFYFLSKPPSPMASRA